MDPASLAIGVIPLVIQLVQTAKSIRDLATVYKSAETQLKSLLNKLDYIETICSCLNELLPGLEDDCRSGEPSAKTLFSSLYRIISACYEKAACIHRILVIIYAKQKPSRNPLKTIGSRLLRYRDQVQDCTDELDGLLSLLQLQIPSVTLATRIRTPQKIVGPSFATTGLPKISARTSSEAALESSRLLCSRRHRSQVTTETWRQCWEGVAFVQRTKEQTKSTILTSPEFSIIQNDSTVTLGISLLNWHVKFSMRQGALSPSAFSFQLPRVISVCNKGSLFERGIEQAFLKDNLEKVQELFREGILTPATILSTFDYNPDKETSLLGLAVLTRASRLLEFLTNQTSDIFTRSHLCSPSFSYLLNRAEDTTQVIEYINLRKDFITPGEFSQILTAFRIPSNTRLCIEACREYFVNDWEPFNDAVWEYIKDHFKRLKIGHVKGWAALVADAISRGLNVHQRPSLPSSNGVFVGILHYHDDSGSILTQMHHWIDMLELAGVNTDDHVRFETEFCFATWEEDPPWIKMDSSTSNYRRALTMVKSRGRQLPCWVQTAENECPIRNLLNEFQHFMTPVTFSSCYMTTGKCIKQYQAWKKGQIWDFVHDEEKASNGWPFWYPLQQYPLHEGSKEDIDWLKREVALMENRFERKQNRKWRKAGRQEGFRKSRVIPGSWI